MAAPPQDYSTLETAVHATPQHSTLEPIYYAYGSNPATADGGLMPTFDPNNESLSAKEAYQAIETHPDNAADRRAAGGFMKRRVCGMGMKLALVLGVILLLVIIGAAVGGAIAGTKGKKDTSSTSTATTTSSTASPPTTGQ